MKYGSPALELVREERKEWTRASGGGGTESGEVGADETARRCRDVGGGGGGGGGGDAGGNYGEWSPRDKRHYTQSMATHIRGIFTCRRLKWESKNYPDSNVACASLSLLSMTLGPERSSEKRRLFPTPIPRISTTRANSIIAERAN